MSRSCLLSLCAKGISRKAIWLHAIGGGVNPYRELAERLGDVADSIGIQVPGLASGKPIFTTVEEMAELYVSELRRTSLLQDSVLIGWCIGGLVAYEMARLLLKESGVAPPVILIDTALFPERSFSKTAGRIWLDRTKWKTFLTITGEATLSNEVESNEKFWSLSNENRLEFVIVAERHRLSSEARQRARRRFLESSWRYFETCWVACRERYHPAPVEHDILLIMAADFKDRGAAAHWGNLVGQKMRTIRVPGTHPSILTLPDCIELVSVLREEIRAIKLDTHRSPADTANDYM